MGWQPHNLEVVPFTDTHIVGEQNSKKKLRAAGQINMLK